MKNKSRYQKQITQTASFSGDSLVTKASSLIPGIFQGSF
jgi:hypothetical protein